MDHVVLVGWGPEASERAESMRVDGLAVELLAPRGQQDLRAVRERPPDAFVVALDRRPSEGRAVAVMLRRLKATRPVPIMFAGGDPEQVERARELLPDATFTDWAGIVTALETVRPLVGPVVPGTMDAYAGASLGRKLGVREGSAVRLIDAPEGLAGGWQALGVPVLPDGNDPASIVVLFVRSRIDLEERLRSAADVVPDRGCLWIAWPKQASGVASDLTQPLVRAIGMRSGLVDYKVAALDETWSGLRFARRRQ